MNNRQYKFRAWDKREHKMYLGPKEIWHQGSWFDAHCNSAVPNDVEFMQYTGLKDKNGTEIYEGDILKYVSTEYVESSDLYEVMFHRSAFRIRWISPNNKMKEYETLISAFDLEVIGNIYENPELLSETTTKE